MLKYIRGLVLCLVILIGVAYVPPTYAASADIVITQIQAGGVGVAFEEIVVLYNNSLDDVNISDWCVTNKSNIAFACFDHDASEKVVLPANSFATIASHNLAATLGFYEFSILYSVTNQSSGSIVGGSDTISLVSNHGEVIDSHSWTTSLVGGMLFVRSPSFGPPLTYFDNDQSSDWRIESPSFIPDSQVVVRDADPDICPNIDGNQFEVPGGMKVGNNGDCLENLLALKLSEILPNVSGSDVGKEFIEIYNPNDTSVDLERYGLRIGQSFENTYLFPEGTSIAPYSYLVFTNTELGYNLLNTSSRVLLWGDGETLDESPSYEDPDEDTSWAVIEGSWQYTNNPTPNAENGASRSPGELTNNGTKRGASNLKPCNENQYRSPETNRCRNLETAKTNVRVPCKDGQYRSEETNRCRNLAVSSEVPTPCKEGQERNPETNRCRTMKAMSSVDYGVLGATTSNQTDQLYIGLVIGGILLCAVAYAVWEWRFELTKLYRKLVGFVRIRK
jgi:hypothetical protein